MKINIIAAIGKNRELGKNNDLLWYIPEDFRYFKEVTHEAIVIMGRRTYLSLPEKFRPLPGRTHVVLMMKEEQFDDYDHAQVTVVHTIEEAIKYAGMFAQKHGKKEVFVLGGASVYEQMIPRAHQLYLTEVGSAFPEADVFFPEFSKKEFSEKTRSAQSNDDFHFDFVVYERGIST